MPWLGQVSYVNPVRLKENMGEGLEMKGLNVYSHSSVSSSLPGEGLAVLLQ